MKNEKFVTNQTKLKLKNRKENLNLNWKSLQIKLDWVNGYFWLTSQV